MLPTNLEAGLLQYDDWQLQLSLDLMLQRAAREALKKQMAVYKGKRGTVIIMDAHSGELLTLVTEPTYDPNRYFETDYELFKNWTVADLYEPGSTFKPINVAIALDAEVITPESTVYDEGQMGFGPHVIRNHDYQQKGGHGVIDIAGILRVSSNIGMIKIMQKMPAANFHTKLLELGLTRKTGIDLPGEATGQVADQERFTGIPVESATPAFGQSISLTPIKLVQLHAALANGGKLVTPHFVKGLRDSQGKWHYQPKLTEKPVFTEQTARSVLTMMETVVTDGSGKASQIAGYRIAGKTGTAQKVGPNGGYLPNAKITSFVSIFPVDQPKYVVLALIDEPQGPHTYGSTVAAPIVKEVLDALIVREEIPPSP